MSSEVKQQLKSLICYMKTALLFARYHKTWQISSSDKTVTVNKSAKDFTKQNFQKFFQDELNKALEHEQDLDNIEIP